MPPTTPEMNIFASDYLDYLVERKLNEILETSIDDESTQYTGIHSGLGPPDMSLEQAVDHLRTVPVSQFFDHNAQGWYEGDVAWWMLFPWSNVPAGGRIYLRVTMIAKRVNGQWKTVHWHVSEAVDRAAEFGEIPRV
ncbi:hypothetical protein TARUN_4301 [Trichoderma arundinaceum]|uniref:Uncharacterized protein n=1 Tax=Trichoderma arundinaceum TaxID=490622 RepID=A0A395NPQ8_TRIAR|nr:hypothetical protein TARUN_4301 [Trichoderma arundinaceum]